MGLLDHMVLLIWIFGGISTLFSINIAQRFRFLHISPTLIFCVLDNRHPNKFKKLYNLIFRERWHWFLQRWKEKNKAALISWSCTPLPPSSLLFPLLSSLQDSNFYAPTSWISEPQVSQATEVLTARIKEIQTRFPTWTPDQYLRGMYNATGWLFQAGNQ
jgi:hypothetical protein